MKKKISKAAPERTLSETESVEASVAKAAVKTSASAASIAASTTPSRRAAHCTTPAAESKYRMRELSGLPRQAIHFYIQQGLLPEGEKTGRNMAYYSAQHVERLKIIRKLQQERFLPLKAIRGSFSREIDLHRRAATASG